MVLQSDIAEARPNVRPNVFGAETIGKLDHARVRRKHGPRALGCLDVIARQHRALSIVPYSPQPAAAAAPRQRSPALLCCYRCNWHSCATGPASARSLVLRETKRAGSGHLVWRVSAASMPCWETNGRDMLGQPGRVRRPRLGWFIAALPQLE